jgi:hypothetical protein
MSTVYTNIKNKKLTVETSNTKSPYGTDNKESGGEVVAKFESTWYLQTCITSGHCVVDLPTSNYRFGIFL